MSDQSAEIDDAFDAADFRDLDRIPRSQSNLFFEVLPAAHRMKQLVSGADPFQGCCKSLRSGDIAFEAFDIITKSRPKVNPSQPSWDEVQILRHGPAVRE